MTIVTLAVTLLPLVLTGFVLATLIPWASKCWSLYLLHDARDQLYKAGEMEPRLRNLRIYRDIEFLSCAAIDSVRSGPWALSVWMLLSSMMPVKGGRVSTRYAKQRGELAECDTEACELMFGSLQSTFAGLLPRVGAGNVVALTLSVLAIGTAVVMKLRKRTRDELAEIAEQAMARAESMTALGALGRGRVASAP